MSGKKNENSPKVAVMNSLIRLQRKSAEDRKALLPLRRQYRSGFKYQPQRPFQSGCPLSNVYYCVGQ